jgi:hypothetical protein
MAEYEDSKAKLLEYLRTLPEPDEVQISCACGQHNMTINELIRQVETGTEEGKRYVVMFQRYGD